MKASFEEMYRIIGQINFTLSRINFIVSDQLHNMGLEADRGAFFSDPNTERKFEKLASRMSELNIPPKLESDLKNWVSKFTKYVRNRNTITHSFIQYSIENQEDFKFLNYRQHNGNVSHEVTRFSLDELKALNNQFIELHNEGSKLLVEIENSIPLVNMLKVQNPYESLKEIEAWLTEEDKESKFGFYNQIELIRFRFNTHKAYLAFVDGSIVGFATFIVFENIATIELFEIKPDKRKIGYGKSFVRKLILKFKKEGCNAIALRSIDKVSDTFWEKVGFRNITELKIRGPGFTHFLSLAEGEGQSEKSGQYQIPITIEVYSTFPENSGFESPVFRWSFMSKKSAVVHPVDFEWTIKIFKDNKEVYCNLIKRLDNEDCRVLFGSILVITDINKLLRHIRRIT